MKAVTDKLAPLMSDEPHVALLNNLGGASVLEMSILTNELPTSAIGKNIKFIVGPATMMTSLDMRGFSVSVLPVTPAETALLTAATPTAAWPGCHEVFPVMIVDLPDGLTPIKPVASEHKATADILLGCCEELISAEFDLNALDAKSGDGDTGSTLGGAAKALIGAVGRLPLADHAQLFRAIGQELSQTMGGSSGVLLAIFFTAAGDAASNGLPTIAALKSGLERMQQVGGAEIGDRTMVDALHPALEVLHLGVSEASDAARKGANHTATIIKAKVGRASYINAEQLEGNIDPGAEAVARLFKHLCSQHLSIEPLV
jgi:dihydroxyacetone kinase